jgi:hypothetical protein
MLRERSFAALLAVPLALLGVLLWRLATRAGPPPAGTPPDGGRAAARALAEPPRRAVLPLPVAVPVAVTRTTSIVVPRSNGVYEGVVVGAPDGASLPGAELTFTRGEAAIAVAAGAGGRFRFEPPAPGPWALAAASAPGHRPLSPEWGGSAVLVDARPGAHVRNIRVTLAPADRYRAVVVGPDGGHVAGATVRVLGAGAGEAALARIGEHVTGAGGEAVFDAPDGALLEAAAPGRGRGAATLDFAARVRGEVRIRLAPEPLPGSAQAIAGRVRLAEGGPAAGARVVAWPRWPDPELPPRQAVADAHGAFRVEALEPGSWDLVARGRRRGAARLADVRTGGAPVELALGRATRLRGRVVDGDTGAPVTPFTVVVRQRMSAGAPLRTVAVLDPAGRFEIDGLPEGAAWVVAVAPGHAPSAPLEVTLPSADAPVAEVELALGAGGACEGLVRSRGSGAALAGVAVAVEPDPAAAPAALPLRLEAVTGPDGRFSLRGLPERALSLYVHGRGHHARVVRLGAGRGGEPRGPLQLTLAPIAPGDAPRVELPEGSPP